MHANPSGFSCKERKNLLSDVFCCVCVADTPNRRIVDKPDVLPHQLGKRILVAIFHESSE
jgi:hypothetical protein